MLIVNLEDYSEVRGQAKNAELYLVLLQQHGASLHRYMTENGARCLSRALFDLEIRFGGLRRAPVVRARELRPVVQIYPSARLRDRREEAS